MPPKFVALPYRANLVGPKDLIRIPPYRSDSGSTSSDDVTYRNSTFLETEHSGNRLALQVAVVKALQLVNEN